MEMMYVHTTLGPCTLLCKLHNTAFGTQTRYTSREFLVMEKRLSEVEVTFDCNISALQELSELFAFRGWCGVRTAYSVRPWYMLQEVIN